MILSRLKQGIPRPTTTTTMTRMPRRHPVSSRWTHPWRATTIHCCCFSSAAVPEVEDDDPPASQQQQQPLHYPRLFEPLHLGPDIGVLPNRVLMGSMHTGLEGTSMPSWMIPLVTGRFESHNHHKSLDRMAAYFHERAQGGVGLMVTGGIAPNRAGWTAPFSGQLTNHDEMVRHQVVTQAVHSVQVPIVGQPQQPQAAGGEPTTTDAGLPSSVPARICLQILHAGRYAYHPWAVSASATQSPISPFRARALSRSDLDATKRDFLQTAVLAQQAGYDGVEVMASEGYLLSQFLSPRTNHRTDEYGGPSLENRARWPLEILRDMRQAVGPNFIIIFRLSLLDLVKDGLSFDESVMVAQAVQDAGATILNTGIGWHESRVPTIHTSVPRAAFSFPTHALKQANVVDIPIVATNRINHPQTAEDLLMRDSCDLISMARPFLADAQLLQKARTGQTAEINTCIGCNQACLDHAFVGRTASCLVNPRACHETELPQRTQPLPQSQRLTLGVVGAGPAGCALAVTAAHELGHDVVVYDKDCRIGGQFQMAQQIPGKEEFTETLRYFETLLHKPPTTTTTTPNNDDNTNDTNNRRPGSIEVRLNTYLTAAQMDADTTVDVWIDATGVEPRNPHIPGQDHAPNVVTYIDVLKHHVPVGQRVALIGAGGIGFDVAEYLLHHSAADQDTTVTAPADVDPQTFWKTWGIDTSLQTRGGLVSSAENDKNQKHETASSSPQPQRQLYLLQRKTSKLGKGLGKTTGWIHRTTLKQSGAVEMIAGATYNEIDPQGRLHISITDPKNKTTKTNRVLDVDTIVLCSGQVEHTTLRDEASPALRRRLYAIGGAYQAGELDAKRAIDMGTRLAHQLHTLHAQDTDASTYVHPGPPPPGVEQSMFQLLRKLM